MEKPFITIITITLTLLFIIKHLFINNKYKHYKNFPPSPPSLPIIGHLHLVKKPLHHCFASLADRYGPVVFLKCGIRNVLIVSSPSAAIECFTTNDVVFADRPHIPSFKELSYDYTTMGSLSYGSLWRNFRRIATVEVLSNHRILSFSDVRADEVRQLVLLLLGKYSESVKNETGFTKINLKPRLFKLGMNITMRLIAGKRYYGEGNEISEEGLKFRNIMRETSKFTSFSYPGDYLPVLRWFYDGPQKKMRKLSDERDMLLQELIDEQRRHESNDQLLVGGKKTMIGNLLELQKEDPENTSDLIIKALAISLLQAGTTTTSDTIEWAMALLLNHPKTLKKLRAEIDEHVGNERLLEENDLTNLPYLQCVINETLRLKPATPLLLPHMSSEDCVLQGYNIPGETLLMVNVYSIQRDPKVWKEPLQFKPERFEETKELDDKNITRWMIPFGMGRRKCVGEGLAIKVVGLTLGTLIQCFDWDQENGNEIDMTESSGLTMAKAIPLEAMYRPRSEMIAMLSKACN